MGITVPTFTAGQPVLASDLALLATGIATASKPPIAVMYRSTSQSLTNNSWTTIDLTTESFDTYNGHDNSTNPSRYTVQTGGAGRYLVSVGGAIVANATGGRGIRILKNGTAIEGSGMFQTNATASFGWAGQASVVVDLAVGDYVQMQLFQNSGGAINTDTGSSENYCRMAVTLLWWT